MPEHQDAQDADVAERTGPPAQATADLSRPVALIIMGGSGDLTKRLLLPGLAQAMAAHELPEVTLIGSGRGEMDDAQWRELIDGALADADVPKERRRPLVDGAVWHAADATVADDLRGLFDAARSAAGADAVPVLYFAVGPGVAASACAALAQLDDRPEDLRLVMEKPFGESQESARDLNALLARITDESHIHRVDHFLGESMVTAMLGLRTANRLLERTWNAGDVERVDIVIDESIALEGRAGYYDTAGALKDMLQSHLLQVLAMVALEAPTAIAPRPLQDAVATVLRATHVWDDDAAASSRRARYTAGEVDGRAIPDYAAEEGVDPENRTETLAEVTLAVDTPRWEGVPFRLRSGKALAETRWEVTMTLRPPRFTPEGLTPAEGKDTVVVGLDPQRLAISLAVDDADTPFETRRTQLEADLAQGRVDAYGEVLRGILADTPLLSVRGDVSEESWRIMEPVIAAWKADEVPLEEYPAGSHGPASWS
ncbi:glucose-6-phosphate dehydrogenase [Micrococcus sp.]|uniref:glucose-6-phosphate dehydrogenase n=1 Tax=Micrococcus sp. TaxID=1271 RepID=UPI0026DAFA80|nr:glucose-6-phosphate dehydrogenase [Micrococcus sp.]MDO4238993.1 glucose-6-phosphate dehydrogenase [Micrococcus sp.]